MIKSKSWLVGIMSLILLAGCGKSKSSGTIDTAVLTPLFNARHTADNSVRSLKQLYCDRPSLPTTSELSDLDAKAELSDLEAKVEVSDANVRTELTEPSTKAGLSDSDPKAELSDSETQVVRSHSKTTVVLSDSERICQQARLRYNRTATSINTVLSQLTLAIQSNSRTIATDPFFQQELEQAITSAFELEEFLEATLARPAFLSELPLLINVAAVVNSLVTAMPQFSAAANQADESQKAFIVCELQALKLQPFDSLGKPVTNSKCSTTWAASR